MRLLHVETLEFTEFHEDHRPKYAIASHRWQEDEATFQDLDKRLNTNKKGYKKVEDFAKYIRDNVYGIEWLWIDTCCINKQNATELSKSINLMFTWYRDAEVCLAYLSDVSVADDEFGFTTSVWFKRGWTLQELLAPQTVIFLAATWGVIGNKGASSCGYNESPTGRSLEKVIAVITSVPEEVLHSYQTSLNLSINDRFRWIAGRSTTEPEDMSYALYGIFGVTEGANYGEGYQGARKRLERALKFEENLVEQQTEQFRKITSWLLPPNPWINHDSARERHEPQTGAWLLDCNAYRNWKSASLRHVWIYGNAGCGKTVLCSEAIEDVKGYCKTKANAGCAFFYLSFSDNQKQRYEDVLVSLVAQLGWKEPALSMLQQAYKNPGTQRPGRDDLERILLASAGSLDELFIFIDALDESPEQDDTRYEMMQWLASLSKRAPALKIFATSRELPDIRDSMLALGTEPISITAHSVDADIRKYVATQMSNDYRLSRLDIATKTLIEERIGTKAEGMFRWAYCQLQELKKLKSTRPRFIKEALYSLPLTLDATYERMLLLIEEKLRPDALKLLRWLAYAQRPLSLEELVDATIIDVTGQGSVDIHERPGLTDALEILFGLVTVGGGQDDDALEPAEDGGRNEQEFDAVQTEFTNATPQVKNNTTIRLAHFSVKEFLESKRILQSSAKEFYLESSREHRILCNSCLIYLEHYSRSKERSSADQDVWTFPLILYTSNSWFYHSAHQEAGEHIREARFLCNKALLQDWLKLRDPGPAPGALDSGGSSVYYSSLLGLEQLTRYLLKEGVDVNAKGGELGSALHAAGACSSKKIVQILIEAGAKVNAKRGFYGYALQGAVTGGNEEVVRILIEAGADVNAGEFYGYALQRAVAGGNEEIVRILIEAGAEVNAKGGHYGSALQRAVAGGNEKVVRILIEAGADVNAEGGYYGSALQVAAADGNEEVVQILIEGGAEVNAKGGHYGFALREAAAWGHEKVVQMSIDSGAEINAGGPEYGSALQKAAEHGHDGVARILIANGAVNDLAEPQRKRKAHDVLLFP